MTCPDFSQPEDFLLYRDAMMLVINKPQGYAVQPGKGQHKNLMGLYEQFHFGLPHIPAPAHRLDSPTSGCLILSRHRQAAIKIGKLFENGQIIKKYIALISGHLPHEHGEIAIPIGKKYDRSDNWIMKTDPENGQEAITQYKVISIHGELSLVELTPITGRTHQLRIHMAALDCPIYGDWIYGRDRNIRHGLCLHASELTIPLYPKKESPVHVVAPMPEHMEILLT